MDAPGSLLSSCFNPKKATENHLRICQLITLLCGELFRDILSRHIKPSNLRLELDKNRPQLEKILNEHQKNLIYPATGNTLLTAPAFDISIIYILLRNICNIPSHKNGWGNPPAKGDNSIAAGIEIIQLKRNLILAHSTNGMIDDLEFEKHWKDLRDAVVQIETQLTGSNLYKQGVDFLHSCNLFSVGTEVYHNNEKTIAGLPEVTLNEIPPVQLNEPIYLNATFHGVPKCDRLSVIWVKHDQDINNPNRKYEVTIDKKGSAVLHIKNASHEDVGTYTVEVHDKSGERQSNQILVEVRGSLQVTLKQVPLTYLNECVKLKAKIEGFFKNPCVNWMKDNQDIDITDTKYEGSKHDGDSAVLCIKDVKENDEAIYTVEVSNELEKVRRSQKLVVIKEGEMIFISGPVVVSPSETITFHAFLPNQKISNMKWWKIKDQSKKEVEIDRKKYLEIKEGNNICRFEIVSAEKEDSATYQCIADNMKSNTINVHVDDSGEFSTSEQGNVIRFYALQAVSAKVMRKVINNPPNAFRKKIEDVKKLCKSEKHCDKTWAKEFLSINPINSPEDLDISKMVTMYRNLNLGIQNWNTFPGKTEINEADDIKRIRQYRNRVCHLDASEIETAEFNTWILDLLGAIQRLSKDDHEVIKESCVILNRVFTTVEFKDAMETFAKEPEKLGQHLLMKEKEEIVEKEPEKFGQPLLDKEEEKIKLLENEPEKFDQPLQSEDNTCSSVCCCAQAFEGCFQAFR